MATTNPNDRDNNINLKETAQRARREGSLEEDGLRREVTLEERDTNPDAITGAHGSHPIGTAVGAAGAGAGGTWVGAAIGAVAGGPIGAVLGGVIGAVAGAIGGGYAGKAVAESIDPTVENEYWSGEHVNRPYYQEGHTYDDDYAPAYRHGLESRVQYHDREFDEVESEVGADWHHKKGNSRLSWDQARHAVRDAWDRVSSEVDRAAYPDKTTPRDQSKPDAVRNTTPVDLRATVVDPRNT